MGLLPFLKGANSLFLETTMRVEGELQDIAVNTADHREGVAAFLQKRPAAFTGH